MDINIELCEEILKRIKASGVENEKKFLLKCSAKGSIQETMECLAFLKENGIIEATPIVNDNCLRIKPKGKEILFIPTLGVKAYKVN